MIRYVIDNEGDDFNFDNDESNNYVEFLDYLAQFTNALQFRNLKHAMLNRGIAEPKKFKQIEIMIGFLDKLITKYTTENTAEIARILLAESLKYEGSEGAEDTENEGDDDDTPVIKASEFGDADV